MEKECISNSEQNFAKRVSGALSAPEDLSTILAEELSHETRAVVKTTHRTRTVSAANQQVELKHASGTDPINPTNLQSHTVTAAAAPAAPLKVAKIQDFVEFAKDETNEIISQVEESLGTERVQKVRTVYGKVKSFFNSLSDDDIILWRRAYLINARQQAGNSAVSREIAVLVDPKDIKQAAISVSASGDAIAKFGVQDDVVEEINKCISSLKRPEVDFCIILYLNGYEAYRVHTISELGNRIQKNLERVQKNSESGFEPAPDSEMAKLIDMVRNQMSQLEIETKEMAAQDLKKKAS